MAGRLSDADANNALDVRFGGVASTAPASYFVGLSSTQPTNTGGNVTEPVVAGYGRVAVANNATNWPAASGRTKSNGTAVSFPVPTVDWGTLGYFVLYDAVTGGTMRAWGQLAAPVAITIGATASFAPGQLVINAPGT